MIFFKKSKHEMSPLLKRIQQNLDNNRLWLKKQKEDEVEAKIKGIVSEIFEIPAEKITNKSRIADLGGDSLDMVEVCMEIEDKFKIPEIDLEVIDEFETIGQLESYVAGAVAAKN